MANYGQEMYQNEINRFYRTACEIINMSYDDLLFEDIKVLKKQSYFIEVHISE